MAVLAKQNFKWIIIVTFVGILFIPGMMPTALFKTIALVGLGSICLIFEFLSLKNLDSKAADFKSDFRQTWLLIGLTIVLLVVNFLV